MIINLHGLAFKMVSPSAFVLKSVRDDIDDPTARVVIAFNGHKWWLHYQSKYHNVSRPFKSRDAAIRLLADRVQV